VQTGQFQRVGSGDTISVDVRIVCATNRDPLEMVRQGRFREDLYYRLHVVPVQLPPLRERGPDVLLIARTFLARFSLEEGKRFEGFTPECEQLLLRHRWPGNVRELENVVRNVVVLNDAPLVTPQMLPAALLQDPTAAAAVRTAPAASDAAAELVERPATVAPPAATGTAPASPATVGADLPTPSTARAPVVPLWQVERDAIEAAIARFDGNIPRAAAALEISPSTIYRKRQAWADAGQLMDQSA
jgi:two-component system repressor protein LuxO